MDRDSLISHEYPKIRGNVFDSNTVNLDEDILNLATECEGMDKASGECDNMVSFKEFLSSLKDDE